MPCRSPFIIILVAVLTISFPTAETGAQVPPSPPSAAGEDGAATGATGPATGNDAEFFEKRIRPILHERCGECHSSDVAESDLSVDSRGGLLRGGTRGPAVLPGDPAKSLMILAVNHADQLHMPPKSKIPVAEIAALTEWVRRGAPWPASDEPAETVVPTDAGGEPDFTAARRFWSFRPPTSSPIDVGSVGEKRENPIDHFIDRRLRRADISPAPRASRRALIRRATWDLIGLPPTASEIDAFLGDRSPDAFARLIDRLLASPRYGERWGRIWLDVARYSDSNGMDENLAYANAYRYRDYVVRSFNQDKPFDQFLMEQLAGDLMPERQPDGRNWVETNADERIVATGFLSLGAKMLAEDDPVKMRMDIVDEQVDTVGRAFIGLTLGCARCHDHKFDPIPTADYYALAGIFGSTHTMEDFKVVAKWFERQVPTLAPHPASGEPARTGAQGGGEDAPQQVEPPAPMAMAVRDGDVGDLRIHIRGSHVTLGDVVPRRLPRLFAASSRFPIGGDASGRLELARWLTHPDHPLTARVIVNRVWQGHFGHGLVRTPDNFGRLGERPTHPELLDSLAVEFVRRGWSIKTLHRSIMNSETYRRATTWDPRAAEVDPENRLLWRMNRRRLDAEQLRDGILALAGNLDDEMGGSLLSTPNREYVTSTANVDAVAYRSRRRSIYLPVIRSALYDMFQVFDFADPSHMNGRRQSTTVAPQSLFLMNGEFVAEQALVKARSLLADERADDRQRVARLFDDVLGRPPTDREIAGSLDYVQRYAERYRRPVEGDDRVGESVEQSDARREAWRSLCRALLCTNEFLYVE